MAAFERGVARRCTVFFVLSATWAGSANVLPQIYLFAKPADDRSVTLAWLLSLATLASMAGVASSRRLLQRGRRLEPASFVLGWVVMLGLLSVVVLGRASLVGYALALCGFRLACGLLTNHLDHHLLTAAGPAGASTHAAAVAGLGLVGATLGPAAFALGSSWPQATAVAVVAFALLALPLALDGLSHSCASDRCRPEATPAASVEPAVGPTIFVLYCLLVLSAVIGFTIQLIYLLEEHVGVGSPQFVGGLLLTLTGAAATTTVFASSRFRHNHASGGRRAFIAGPMLLLIALAMFLSWPTMVTIIVAALLSGAGYGHFLVVTRSCASTWNATPTREVMLSRYNNLPNLGALVAFASSALVAWLAEDFAPVYLGVSMMLVVLAIVTVLIPTRSGLARVGSR
jgi:hypothetical protein